MRAAGRQVVDVIGADRWDFETAARATVDAMRAGAQIIYQATFVLGDWRGRADFLERIEQKTALGPWGYEALDAKLARAEKPTYVLQLCFYTEAIAAIQEAPPSAMHVLLGIGERRTLRHADFDAYYRRVRAGFLAALDRAQATEPYRVDHCALCEFRDVCDERWTQEDHLALVAGIRRGQVTRLRSAGVGTLAQLAQHRRRRFPTSLLTHWRLFTTRLGCSSAGGPPEISTGTLCPSSRGAGSSGCPGPRRATSCSTSRAIRSGSRRAACISSSAC
jgi:uncharacterized protein